MGLASMAIPMYIAELAPPKIRGTLLSLNIVFITGGQFISCAVAVLLLLFGCFFVFLGAVGMIHASLTLLRAGPLVGLIRLDLKAGKKGLNCCPLRCAVRVDVGWPRATSSKFNPAMLCVTHPFPTHPLGAV